MWSLIKNATQGVSEGFSKALIITGTGYRAALQGNTLVLSLGYAKPIEYRCPPGIEITIEKNTVRVSGIDKELVGRVAAEIRAFRKPEPYKGKGIRYKDEVIIRKAGKKAVTAAPGT